MKIPELNFWHLAERILFTLSHQLKSILALHNKQKHSIFLEFKGSAKKIRQNNQIYYSSSLWPMRILKFVSNDKIPHSLLANGQK